MTATSALGISVVIPVRNGETYLGEAIASVLAQSEPVDQVIVVDDGSRDGSARVAESFGGRVICVRLPERQGIGGARNTGVQAARGEWLSFLDADDVWFPEKLALQMRAVTSDPSVDGVFGHTLQFVSPELSEEQRQRFRFAPQAVPGIIAGTLLIRRPSFDRVGPFRSDLKVGEFVDWYARAIDAGLKFVVLPDVLLQRRLHESNTGMREVDQRSDYARVLKAALERRRAAARNPDGSSND